MTANDDPDAGGECIPPRGGQPAAPSLAPWGICARCHWPLTRPSVVGGCLRCIVNFVDPDEDNPLVSIPADGEEVRRYSHFEIVLREDGSLDELGHGSMGTTYRAVDTVLQSPVALKIIGRNVVDSPVVRARFLREARTAARLRHPNVASVFHYGEQEGECFYVMELVEGETLEERVRRDGPLPTTAALELTEQIAHALAAAEAQGLVHRDLKPSNVMLVTGGRPGAGGLPAVKVIDFGLARAAASEGDAPGLGDTRSGFVGTPAFASPEQFARREDERIDTRSDIYSLGVTLWYLLCGKVPFVGKTLTEVHEQQARLPLEQLRAARVPAPVAALLRSMLAIAPVDRPQNVRELLDALHRCQRRLLTTSRNRYARLAGALALLALLVLGIALWREHTRPPVPPVDRSVAVLPFENLGTDRDAAFFTDGVQDEIAGELARIAQLKVVQPGSGHERGYPPGPRDLAAIGRELGVGYLVEGTVRRGNDQVQVTVRLSGVHDKAPRWTKQYAGQLADIFAIQREITREVADRLRATLSPGEQAILDEPPTTDPVAYDLYLRVVEGPQQFNGPVALRKGMGEQLVLLDQAVARDPKFVLAYCLIAEWHDEISDDMDGATAEEKAVDHRTLAEVALQKARRIHPDEGMLHLAQAHHFLLGSHDDEQAQIEIDLARRTLPNNADVEQMAGLIARSNGRGDEALRCFERAYVLRPRETGILTPLSRLYRVMRHYPEADAMSAKLLALRTGPDGLYDRLLRATIPLEEKADVAPLRALLAAATPEDDPDYLTIYRLVLALCTRDSDAVARALAEAPADHTIRYQGVDYPKGWFEGVAARMRGDEPASRTAFARARAEIEPVVQANVNDARTLSLLAVTDAGLGRADDAIREGRRACELADRGRSTKTSTTSCQLAVVYAWLDQRDQAFALLDELIDRPAGTMLLDQPTYGDFRLNPVWDSLHNDPRFAALVEKLAPKPAR